MRAVSATSAWRLARIQTASIKAPAADRHRRRPGRTGTTWLHRVLERPLAIPRIKETQFFSTYYDNGYRLYAGIFATRTGERKIRRNLSYLFSSARSRSHIKAQHSELSSDHHSCGSRSIIHFRRIKWGTHYAWRARLVRRGLLEVAGPNSAAGNDMRSICDKWLRTWAPENRARDHVDECATTRQK